jgi:hypothetical protein
MLRLRRMLAFFFSKGDRQTQALEADAASPPHVSVFVFKVIGKHKLLKRMLRLRRVLVKGSF